MITDLPAKPIARSQWLNISQSFTYKMAAKSNWHRYRTKLRHCHVTLCTGTSKDGMRLFNNAGDQLTVTRADETITWKNSMTACWIKKGLKVRLYRRAGGGCKNLYILQTVVQPAERNALDIHIINKEINRVKFCNRSNFFSSLDQDQMLPTVIDK